MPCPAERLNAAGDAPKPLRDVLTRARGAWLRSEHVVDLLRNHRLYNFPVSRAPPSPPPASGCLFLFNRRATRYFRRDGHSWRTKSDGKTVRETHEKLKVAGRDALNCYYAHSDEGGTSRLQRRCYWLLEADEDIVLVHYLCTAVVCPLHLTHPSCNKRTHV